MPPTNSKIAAIISCLSVLLVAVRTNVSFVVATDVPSSPEKNGESHTSIVRFIIQIWNLSVIDMVYSNVKHSKIKIVENIDHFPVGNDRIAVSQSLAKTAHFTFDSKRNCLIEVQAFEII